MLIEKQSNKFIQKKLLWLVAQKECLLRFLKDYYNLNHKQNKN
jgi:hypothetical protein